MTEVTNYCGICYHNIKEVCQLSKKDIENSFASCCSQYKPQIHCVICLMAIQEEETYSHPEGGRICQDCHDYMGDDSY